MFTLQDFERIKREKQGIESAILFSIERDGFAYAMSCLNSKERGDYAESMVRDGLRNMGYRVEHLGGAINRYDLKINHSIRAEVKMATFRKSGRYVCEKVKPELFDIVFMLFLTPDGMVIRWATTEDVQDWASWHKRGKEGYSISFNRFLDNHHMRYRDFDSFLYYYHPKRLKYLAC
jgi:hypothetical protein